MKDGRVFKAAVAQFVSGCFTKEENEEKILTTAEKALAQGVQLILFPEGADLGYIVLDRTRTVEESQKLALSMANGPASSWVEAMKGLAARGIFIGCGSFFKTEEYGLANALLFFTPSGEWHVYRKTHLYHEKGAHEGDFVAPGDTLAVWETGPFTVGPSICYDLNFPEVFRTIALKGARIVLMASAWPAAAGDVWDKLLPTRAIENQVFVVASNQTGGGYYGHSKIVDFSGKVLAAMGEEEGFAVAEIDLNRQEKWRKIVTYFDDRRPELYG